MDAEEELLLELGHLVAKRVEIEKQEASVLMRLEELREFKGKQP